MENAHLPYSNHDHTQASHHCDISGGRQIMHDNHVTQLEVSSNQCKSQ